MGLFLLYESIMSLISFEHPSIGVVQPFGEPIWLGWLMIAALLWGLVPPLLLGRAKLPLARELHDKILFADAEMNRADWLTAGAAILGIVGIIWILQGFDFYFAPESFMTGDRAWVLWGVLALLAGGSLIWRGKSRK